MNDYGSIRRTIKAGVSFIRWDREAVVGRNERGVKIVYVIYVITFILYSWYLLKVGKKHAERKDEIKLVITGKPEQIKEAIKAINEQNLIK